jgi:hypothetical protein
VPKKLPITRVWHAIDVGVGVAAVIKRPSMFNIARLGFALIGLAGNVFIEQGQLRQNIIEVGGVKWKRLD